MHDVSIAAWGSYLPRLAHSNVTLPPLDEPATPEDLERIGVIRRHWAGEGEGIAEMAAAAVHRALDRAGWAATELDAIVLANWTQRRFIPEFAPRLQQLIGAPRACAYDVCCACAGFLYGLGMAHSFLQNPRFTRVAVVAAETTSQRARPRSKATLVFGDGAGAAVLERSNGAVAGRLIDYELATFGDQHDIMEIDDNGWVKTHVKQNEIGALAARTSAAVLDRILARQQLTNDDIQWLIPHSGTAGVQAALARTLGFPRERTLTNFAHVGNLSSASIPVALDYFVERGIIRPGDLVASTAVGTGWYAAAALYTA